MLTHLEGGMHLFFCMNFLIIPYFSACPFLSPDLGDGYNTGFLELRLAIALAKLWSLHFSVLAKSLTPAGFLSWKA